jgi:hypothetical protein
MAYTNNVPQTNQQIATTQPIIQANFGFVQTGVGQEHNFNAAGSGTDMYHLQASMPNKADPVSLPVGTTGQYYVSGAAAKFYNGTASFIQTTSVLQKVLTGTVALSASVANVVTIPQNSVGQYYIFIKGGNGFAVTSSASGLFLSDTTSLQLCRSSDFDPEITVSSLVRTLRAVINSGGRADTYTYLIVYYNP